MVNTEAAKETADPASFASLAPTLLHSSEVQHWSLICIDPRETSLIAQSLLQPPVEVHSLSLNKYRIHHLRIAFKICVRVHACVRVCICPDWASMKMHMRI